MVEETKNCSYLNYKNKLDELELVKIKQKYLKKETEYLSYEYARAVEEVNRIKSVPLLIGQLLERIDESTAIVSSTTGTNTVVRISRSVNSELLKPNSTVALHRHSSAIVDVLPPEADSTIPVVGETEKPDITYDDIGGMDIQKQEIRETVEFPLRYFDKYLAIGIEPPKAVLLWGPPGTGKTMLVKAVANQTEATFIKINGSEFVQKYLGEGPRMVRDVFRLAQENAPTIVFIDEIDSIATKRMDASTSADREVQRVLIELLNQLDGFDQNYNVKVIMATNKPESIDPALLRPGRLDRKIEFPYPDKKQKRQVFSAITSKMNLDDNIDFDPYVNCPDRLSCADINSICQEAAMLAVRNQRYMVIQKDFEEAYSKVVGKTDNSHILYN